MQTLCLLLPEPYAQRVTEARAKLMADAALGRVHDPPFAHFTLQMADDYDWEGLAPALAAFARQQQPIPIRTVGLLCVTGAYTGVAIEPYRDTRLADFHAALWDVVTPFARGTVADFYLPDRWVPHVTVKRCGTDPAAFGRAMCLLADDTYRWTMDVPALAVQHDVDNNNQTRYQRLYEPLGPAAAPPRTPGATNATIERLDGPAPGEDEPTWTAHLRTDAGPTVDVRWTGPETAYLQSEARAAISFFAGGRCTFDGTRVTRVVANTPVPVVY
jgi:hypothetical protein